MSARPPGHDELRARLREAAARHEPDRARMLARVERGTAARSPGNPRPALAGWAGVAATVAAVAGVLAAGGYAVTSAAGDPAPAGDRTAAASPAPLPASTPDTRDGPLRSTAGIDPNSNAYWAQSDVHVTVAARLTAFTLRVDVARTGGVESTGAWLTLPEDDFVRTVTTTAGSVRYTWTLRPGRTVTPGAWLFAAQYNHAQGARDAGSDTYTATGTTENGQRGTVQGHFAAQDAGAGTDG